MTESKCNVSFNKDFYTEEKTKQTDINRTPTFKIENKKKKDTRRQEREKALKEFPMLSYKHTILHPFSHNILLDFIKRRPKDVSVSTIIELFIKKSTSSQYLHLIRKRVPRRHLNGGIAEEITDEDVYFAKLLLSEKYKDKHGFSMEEDKKRKVVRKRRPKVNPKTGVIIKDKEIRKRKKRDNRNSSTPEYRYAHIDKSRQESAFSSLGKMIK